MKPLINVADLTESRELSHADKFSARLYPIASKIGAKRLGYNLTVVPPGKAAFPFHNHHGNEELFYVIEGTGKLRFGQDEFDVCPGDVVACPPGGPEKAHQFVNTGTVDLKYLAVGTTLDCDVYQYPDSGKVGMTGGRVPGTWPPEASFQSKFYDESANIDYWKGE